MSPINHILLIDDDYICNFIHEKVVQTSGLCEHIKTVLRGIDGLQYLKMCTTENKPLPDIIFLDINMPEMNGWDFLDHFAQLDAEIREGVQIYMLSSSQNEGDLLKASNNSLVSGFLHKPLSIEALQEKFNKKGSQD